MNDSVAFGFSFPFRIDPASGQIATATGDQSVRDNVFLLVQTEIGERPLGRNRGAGLRAFVHEPLSDAFLILVEQQVGRAIAMGEPRVQVVDIDVRGVPHGDNIDGSARLEIELVYSIRRTQQLDRFKITLPLSI